MENYPNVYAAEKIYKSRDYVPNEGTSADISDITGTELQNGDKEEWYRVTQTTNYTYDGKTEKINAKSCNLNVKTYYADCDYTVNTNEVDNSCSTDPTYTIGLTMKLGSQSLTIQDVVIVHANGTYNRTHYQK